MSIARTTGEIDTLSNKQQLSSDSKDSALNSLKTVNAQRRNDPPRLKETRPVNSNEAIDTAGRFFESTSRAATGTAAAGFYARNASDEQDSLEESEKAWGLLIGNGAVLLVSFIAYLAIKFKWKVVKGGTPNPFFRVCKMLASVGFAAGTLAASLMPSFLPWSRTVVMLLVANVAAIAFAVLAIPISFVKNWNPKKLHLAERPEIAGKESLSKTARAGMVVSKEIGSLANSIADQEKNGFVAASEAASIGGFFLTIAAIYLINKLVKRKPKPDNSHLVMIPARVRKKVIVDGREQDLRDEKGYLVYEPDLDKNNKVQTDKDGEIIYKIQMEHAVDEKGKKKFTRDKEGNVVPVMRKVYELYYDENNNTVLKQWLYSDDVRVNFIRAGLTLGAAIGALLAVGLAFIPGVNLVVQIVGSVGITALTSLGVGTFCGIKGSKIDKRLHKSDDSDNSWDYAARSAFYTGASAGSLIGFMVGGPAGLLVGGLIGGIVGWFGGVAVTQLARTIEPNEKDAKASTLPWSQRIATGNTIGLLVGVILGLAIGLASGPLGVVVGPMVFGAACALIGSGVGVFADKKAVQLISRGVYNYIHMLVTETRLLGAAIVKSTQWLRKTLLNNYVPSDANQVKPQSLSILASAIDSESNLQMPSSTVVIPQPTQRAATHNDEKTNTAGQRVQFPADSKVSGTDVQVPAYVQSDVVRVGTHEAASIPTQQSVPIPSLEAVVAAKKVNLPVEQPAPQRAIVEHQSLVSSEAVQPTTDSATSSLVLSIVDSSVTSPKTQLHARIVAPLDESGALGSPSHNNLTNQEAAQGLTFMPRVTSSGALPLVPSEPVQNEEKVNRVMPLLPPAAPRRSNSHSAICVGLSDNNKQRSVTPGYPGPSVPNAPPAPEAGTESVTEKASSPYVSVLKNSFHSKSGMQRSHSSPNIVQHITQSRSPLLGPS